MIRIPVAVLLALWAVGVSAAGRPSLTQPAISPDGREIAFASGGDLWTAPLSGGDARLLVSGPSTESRPVYSPDGKSLAFVSDRTGNGDIYVVDVAGSAMRRLTFDDGFDQLDSWSRDGSWIYYSSGTADIAGMNDVYRVRPAGGTPMPVSADRYTNEFAAAPSPDGGSIAMSARGLASSQWWRNGHSHIDESEIWLLTNPDRHEYRRLVTSASKNVWPMWTPAGDRVLFMSDRTGAENLWSASLGGGETALTSFTSGRVLWPSISADGKTIAFERDFGVWTADTSSGKAAPVPIALRGVPSGPSVEHRRLTGGFDEIALSPDGKKVAFVVHGEVFAAAAKDGGDAARVTSTPEAEYHLAWAPDSRRLAYASERDGAAHLYLYDFASGTETRLTADARPDMKPRFSPDGKSIAFLRRGRELRIVDPATKADRLLTAAEIDFTPPIESERPFVWSPDGRWIAFGVTGERMFRNASVVRVDDPSRIVPVSFLANVANNTLAWTPDGNSIFFDTAQRTEASQVARVDLVPRTPRFRETQFRELFREETPKSVPSTDKADDKEQKTPEAAKPSKQDSSKPVEIVAEGIRQRMTYLPVSLDVQAVTVSPDGKQLLLTATAVGQDNLYLYPLDELAKEPPVAKQLTSTDGQKRNAQFSPDGKEVFYLEQGKIFSITVEGQKSKPLAVTAEMDVDFDREKEVMFGQAWGWMRDHFHDPKMNGVDWDRVRRDFAPHIEAARTSEEVTRLLAMMIGELNASHLNSRPGGTLPKRTGRIGLRFDRVEYENGGALRITGVVPLSPAAVTGKIAPGDYLLAVNGVPLGGAANLDQLLENTIEREVKLTVAGSASGANRREVSVKPSDSTTEKGLLYRQWVENNRAYVDQVSGGKAGYVHLFDMAFESLQQLMIDLDAGNIAKLGVVVDVRNNNGGFINPYVLDILGRRPYLNMTFRGLPTAPARAVLGQRALERPSVLVTNQHSLSDAEDLSEGFRALGLGRIVGEPTSGWIIYTTNVSLIDGSFFRIPFITITTDDGAPMEMHPRPVDVEVSRPIGESYTGRDSQLDAAVRELMK